MLVTLVETFYGTGLKSGSNLTPFYVLTKMQCHLFQLSYLSCRLTKEVNDEPKSIDWLELLKAVQNQVCE